MRTFDLTAALGDRANQPEISRLLVAQLMTSNNEDTRKLRRLSRPSRRPSTTMMRRVPEARSCCGR